MVSRAFSFAMTIKEFVRSSEMIFSMYFSSLPTFVASAEAAVLRLDFERRRLLLDDDRDELFEVLVDEPSSPYKSLMIC